MAHYFLHNALLPLNEIASYDRTSSEGAAWAGGRGCSLTSTPLFALYPSRVEETGVVLSLEQTERHSRRHSQRGTPSQKDTPNPGDSLGMGQGRDREGLWLQKSPNALIKGSPGPV